MGLRHIIPVLALLIQLLGLTEADTEILPQLRDNKLAEGAEKYFPDAQPLQCGPPQINEAILKQNKEIAQSMRFLSTFQFTARVIESQNSLNIVDNIGKFAFAAMKGTKNNMYALQVNPDRAVYDVAYWLPLGGFIDIPRYPSENAARYVFTPDFMSGALTITPLGDKHYRLRRVEDGKEASQFNDKPAVEKGGPITYAMQYKDYAFYEGNSGRVGNITAFAYMHWEYGSWTLSLQRRICGSTTGGYKFTDNLLTSMMMLDAKRSTNVILGTRDYYIP